MPSLECGHNFLEGRFEQRYSQGQSRGSQRRSLEPDHVLPDDPYRFFPGVPITQYDVYGSDRSGSTGDRAAPVGIPNVPDGYIGTTEHSGPVRFPGRYQEPVPNNESRALDHAVGFAPDLPTQ